MTVRITTEQGVDVTEGVQAAYDLVLNSMDWGSGFLSVEDVEPIIRLAVACGYDTGPIVEYLAGRVAEYELHATDEARQRSWDQARVKAREQIEAIRQEMQP